MTTDELVIAQLAEANPVPETASPTAQERAQAERVLRRVLNDAPPPPRRTRRRLGLLAPVVSVLVVLVVVAVALRTGGSSTTGTGGSGAGTQITLSAQPTAQTPRVTATAMSREIALMRHRLASLGRGFTVTQSGAHEIVVTAPRHARAEPSRIVSLITQPAQLRFYDWEASVLTPNGRTVSSQLLAQNPTALSVSQGSRGGAGSPGAGSMPLYDAVRLAARQPARLWRPGSRVGPQYFMFAASRSRACAAAGSLWGLATPISGTHCLLAGPLEPGPVSRQRAIEALAAQLPPGVTASQGQVMAVPQGTVVVEAVQLQSGAPVPVVSPAARFFVLRDDVALTGTDVVNPRPGTDASGTPDVSFGLTAAGRRAFQLVTRTITTRGAAVSRSGAMFNQHFAVAVDDQLITVPQIDFRQYPDGILAGGGADLSGPFTAQSAKDMATELRYGPLPLALRVVLPAGAS